MGAEKIWWDWQNWVGTDKFHLGRNIFHTHTHINSCQLFAYDFLELNIRLTWPLCLQPRLSVFFLFQAKKTKAFYRSQLTRDGLTKFENTIFPIAKLVILQNCQFHMYILKGRRHIFLYLSLFCTGPVQTKMAKQIKKWVGMILPSARQKVLKIQIHLIVFVFDFYFSKTHILSHLTVT